MIVKEWLCAEHGVFESASKRPRCRHCNKTPERYFGTAPAVRTGKRSKIIDGLARDIMADTGLTDLRNANGKTVGMNAYLDAHPEARESSPVVQGDPIAALQQGKINPVSPFLVNPKGGPLQGGNGEPVIVGKFEAPGTPTLQRARFIARA